MKECQQRESKQGESQSQSGRRGKGMAQRVEGFSNPREDWGIDRGFSGESGVEKMGFIAAEKY